MTELSDAWQRLHMGADADEGYVRLRLSSIAACATYAARRIGDGLEALVLEVSTVSIPAVLEYPQSAGFEVISEALEPGRFGRTRLLLSLTHDRFRDVFPSLCEDILRSLSTATGESEAVRLFVSRLSRWQAFLRKHEPGGLSLEQRRGLFGELTFLHALLVRGMAGIQAVSAWKGCRGANHDFQFPYCSLETKTTSATTPHAFHVNNVGQLDDHGLKALFLNLIVLEESTGGATALPEFVESIRTMLDGKAANEFEDSLLEAGFLDAQRELYSSPRYTVRSMRFFNVENGFPRLTVDALPSGVEDVKYKVAIAACKPFELDDHHVFEAIVTPAAYNE